MAPKSKKQQAVQEDADKEAIKVGPTVQWLVRDPATSPLIPCPTGRCYSTAAIHDGRLYVFGGWNGLSREEALKMKNITNIRPLVQNLLNVSPPSHTSPAVGGGAGGGLHVPVPPSSAPAGAKKKPTTATSTSGAAGSPNVSSMSPNLAATMASTTSPPSVNSFFATTPADGSRLGTAADGRLLSVSPYQPIHTIPHPCHERDILCFDLGTSAWSVVDSVLGEPHPGSSQCGMADLGGAVMLFGGWDGYKRHSALTLFSQTDDRWKPYPTNSENVPPPLCFHAVCGYGRKLFVHGGETAEGLNPDMYILDLTSLNWSLAPSVGLPIRRSSHTMTILQGLYIVVFGGRNADGMALGDVSIYDINSNHWIVGVKMNGVGPARYGHTAVAVTDRSILIYGGVGPKVGGVGAGSSPANGNLLNSTMGSGAGGGGGGASGGAAASSSGGGKVEKLGEKEREAQQTAALMNAIAAYEMHSDVWLLTIGDRQTSTVTWERCQVRTSFDPVPARAASPATRSVAGRSVAGDSSAAGATPVPANAPLNNGDNLNTAAGGAASAIHSLAGSRAATPTPGLGGHQLTAQALNAAPPPQPRCGHTASVFGNVVYIYGGRTDSVGSVSKDIAVLDITSILPPPPAPATEGRGTRMDTESTMRAPSSAMTQ